LSRIDGRRVRENRGRVPQGIFAGIQESFTRRSPGAILVDFPMVPRAFPKAVDRRINLIGAAEVNIKKGL